MGNSVTSIGNYAFLGCNALKEVEVQWNTPLAVPRLFKKVDLSAVTLIVPAGTKSLYETADVWKDFGTITENTVNIHTPSPTEATLSIQDGNLRINSPVSEKITVFSVNGIFVYANEKQAGETNFNIKYVQDKILIVKGSSGWIRKAICTNAMKW
ncbi:hypothetical protein FACS189421_03880 [Bacteroidia bacterium]|nr:hypothetical protein FACS189421_03880 [Bacteroidia bacterium]GHT49079.1 hypothetical protein FACS189440_14090 [Bacteroidia bacterium]